MSRMQIRYSHTKSDRTIIDTYKPGLAIKLTSELVEYVTDIAFNNKTYERIDIDCGKHGTHVITIAYSDTRDDVIMFADGFVIMPYDLEYKLEQFFCQD